MTVKLDLTGTDFVDSELVDFYDSKTIFFEPTNQLPETVTFKIWGADIERNIEWSKLIELSDYPNITAALKKEGRFTIKGFSTITFEKVIAGEILISPYDKGQFIKLKNGNVQTFRREWNLSKVDDNCFCYHMDTSIFFPYGAFLNHVWSRWTDPASCAKHSLRSFISAPIPATSNAPTL